MIPARLIPVLLIDRQRRVVKTINFKHRTYVGDPFNVIRLFNEKEVDEICVLDIDATADGRGPDFEFAAALAAECFMPLSLGGGISTVEHARRLIGGGVEKLVLKTHATDVLISRIAHEFGAQAVVGCLDYKSISGKRVVDGTGAELLQEASRLQRVGAGEIILQSIDHDGRREGMDLEGIAAVAPLVSAPVIALGGGGGVDHLQAAIAAGAHAAASGSAFTFVGRLRAVLINYPEYALRRSEALQ